MAITITMPALSPTMTEGTLAKWLVSEGEEVHAGDVIAEIETDKATMEIEAADDGTIGRILIDAGTENVAVNTVIAMLLEEGESKESSFAPDQGDLQNRTLVKNAAAELTQPIINNPQTRANSGEDRVFASPLARRLAAEGNINLSSLQGSGPRGRIIKADIQKALSEPPSIQPHVTPATIPHSENDSKSFHPEYSLEPHSAMRRTIARRMTESKQTVPHFYLTIDCVIDELLLIRKELNDRSQTGFKLSVNDLIVKALAIALVRIPEANVSYIDEGLKQYNTVDVSVAVATKRGLITPIIRNADSKGLETISSEIKKLAEKAKDGKLMPEEYQGGTVSLSNLGMFGVKQFDAVINHPQACILAVGAGEQRPVVVNGKLAIGTVMCCTLSVDHRAVDGATGAKLLAAFKTLIEDPMTMLL